MNFVSQYIKSFELQKQQASGICGQQNNDFGEYCKFDFIPRLGLRVKTMEPILRKAIIRPRGKFEVYPDSNEEYRWHIISSNGRTIGASSEGFSSEAYCIENARLELLGILDFFNQINKPIPKSILSPKLIKNG